MSFSDHFAWQLTQLSLQAHRPLLVILKHNRELNQLKQVIQYFDSSIQILSFPDWEILPYERLSPSSEQVTQRLQTLSQLPRFSTGIILTTVNGLLQRLAPKNYVMGHVFQFSLETKIDITLLSQQLIHCGYQRVTTVTLPGEFAMRGSLMDIFPLDTQKPFRIHTNIDTIENLYYFDIETQQPQDPIDSIRIIPAREFLLSEESIAHFRAQGHQIFGQHFLESSVSQPLTIKSSISGIEYYLPLFFENTNILLDYLPSQTHWITPLELPYELEKHWQHINTRYHQLKNDIQWPILLPEQLYQPPQKLLAQLESFKAAFLTLFPVHDLPDLRENHPKHPPEKLKDFLNTLAVQKTNEGSAKILFCTTRLSQQEALLKHLHQINIHPKITRNWQDCIATQTPYQLSTAPVQNAFWIERFNLFVISDKALYSTIPTSSSLKTLAVTSKPSFEEAFSNLSQLAVNDAVVHVDHGIGRYLGLHQITTDQHCSEFIVLAYAEGTKLYVPIQEIRYISRYTGQDNPPLNHLNKNHWRKTKQKALTQVKDTAAELLNLYAQRAQTQGEAFDFNPKEYEIFANSFEFEETPDQTTAITEIIHDLSRTQPMDRLVCGDVGFGKTEVAMRAAFLAIQSKKQVAILAPTTLLADQHYRSFRERFSDWPVTIDWLSRFRTASDTRLIKQSLANGKIDIIIGTHALLSKQIEFKSLGLLIIDEEHHFGVQQKERLKALKIHVNVLTLTATPIPRTLQTALSGLRELSLITTPPQRRLPIKNFIIQRESSLIREAILRELLRGGQIYFVHNRISSLPRVAREIQRWVPEAKIKIAHGQLPEQELAACMEGFYQQQFNLLICTSIIETGLDIPTVNTLIVDRADHFGLAQLHQLRGRVGRSHHQAYAYFLVSDEQQLTQDAHKRLDALKNLTQLGSGFNLASYDLDIRGAGELLGDKQSGTLQGVGFSLYMELLEKTIDMIKAGKDPKSLENTPATISIDLKIPAFIPDSYLPGVSLRLEYYRRIATAKNIESLSQIQQELIDRYDLLPQETQNLFKITALQQIAQPLGIEKIEANSLGGWITFTEQPNIDPARMIQLVQQEPGQFNLAPNPSNNQPRLRFHWNSTTLTSHQKIETVQKILERLK